MHSRCRCARTGTNGPIRTGWVSWATRPPGTRHAARTCLRRLVAAVRLRWQTRLVFHRRRRAKYSRNGFRSARRAAHRTRRRPNMHLRPCLQAACVQIMVLGACGGIALYAARRSKAVLPALAAAASWDWTLCLARPPPSRSLLTPPLTTPRATTKRRKSRANALVHSRKMYSL